MARWILSAGMFSARALCTARRRRKLASGSPPPSLADTVISRVSLVKSWPRLASAAPFFRLIVAHLLCPDIWHLFSNNAHGWRESLAALYQRVRRFANAVEAGRTKEPHHAGRRVPL